MRNKYFVYLVIITVTVMLSILYVKTVVEADIPLWFKFWLLQ